MKRTVHAMLVILASTGIAADSAAADPPGEGKTDQAGVQAQVNGIEIGTQSPPSPETAGKPSRQRCLSQCTTADSKCSSAVRRARAECSRNASTGGRDPFTGRSDYTSWCNHFRNSSRSCGSDLYSRACQARYSQRYGICIDAMYDNIAAMRYDCFRSERSAQNFCREELRDCRAACQ